MERSAGSVSRAKETSAGTGTSAYVAPDGERDVVATEAEAVAQRRRDFASTRCVRRVVEVALRVGRAVVDRGRDDPVAHDQRGDEQLDRAGGAEHVSGARFGRADAEPIRRFAEDRANRL